MQIGQRESIFVGRVPVLGGLDLVGARFVRHCSPRHSHPETEIGVVVTGQRLVRCRDGEHLAGPGSILVFAPHEVHAGAPADSAGSTYRSFLTDRDGPARGLMPSPVVQDPELAGRLVRAHLQLEAGVTGPDIEAELLDAIEVLWHRHGAPASPETPGLGPHHAVAGVRAYLEGHFAERIRLDFLAALAGLSVFHLIRVFRAATGLTPYAYLEQVRVHQAIRMLREGAPIAVVAWRTGFADQSHLTRLFKRLVGVPPGRYQQSALRAAG